MIIEGWGGGGGEGGGGYENSLILSKQIYDC